MPVPAGGNVVVPRGQQVVIIGPAGRRTIVVGPGLSWVGKSPVAKQVITPKAVRRYIVRQGSHKALIVQGQPAKILPAGWRIAILRKRLQATGGSWTITKPGAVWVGGPGVRKGQGMIWIASPGGAITSWQCQAPVKVARPPGK